MATPLPPSPFVRTPAFTLDEDHFDGVIAGPAPILPLEECQEFVPPIPEEIVEILSRF